MTSPVANTSGTATHTGSSSPQNLTGAQLTDAPSGVQSGSPRSITAASANNTSSIYAEKREAEARAEEARAEEARAEEAQKKQEEEQAKFCGECCRVLDDLRTFPERLKAVTDPDQHPTAQQTIDKLQAWQTWTNTYKASDDRVRGNLINLRNYLASFDDKTITPSAEQEQKTHVLSAPILMEHLSTQLGKLLLLLEALPDKRSCEYLPALCEDLDGMKFDPDTVLRALMKALPGEPSILRGLLL